MEKEKQLSQCEDDWWTAFGAAEIWASLSAYRKAAVPPALVPSTVTWGAAGPRARSHPRPAGPGGEMEVAKRCVQQLPA